MPTTYWKDRKLVFIHPIRTAGTSLYHSLIHEFGRGDFTNEKNPHRTLGDLFDEYGHAEILPCLKVMSVRSPYSRIVSWLNWHRKHGGPAHDIVIGIEHIPRLTDYGLKQMDLLVRQENFAADLRKLGERLGVYLGERYLNRSISFPIVLKRNHINAIQLRFREEIKYCGWRYEDVLDQNHKNVHQTFDIGGTPSGYLVTLWNALEDDWRPDQVYLTVVSPNGRKGPHLHAKRIGRFFCIRGRVKATTRDPDGVYSSRWIDDRDPTLFEVPTGTVAEFVNHDTEPAYLLNMPTPAWSPNDQDELPIGEWNPPP